MDRHSNTQHVTGLGTYALVYVALMVLLAITVALDFVLTGTGGLAASLIIAAIKAGLVMVFFMHIRGSTRITWIFAGAAFLWLAIMAGLTFNDYFTRPLEPQRLLTPPASVGGMYTEPVRVGNEATGRDGGGMGIRPGGGGESGGH